jgi:hypothetical protein
MYQKQKLQSTQLNLLQQRKRDSKIVIVYGSINRNVQKHEKVSNLAVEIMPRKKLLFV